MFRMAAKVAMIEALRDVFDAEYPTELGIKPRKIDIEYAEKEVDWPFVLVEFRTEGPVQWTGIDLGQAYEADPLDADFPWRRFRKFYFEGYFTFTVLATTSQERDRLWDQLAKVFLVGRKHAATLDLFQKLESHDLVGMTVLEGMVVEVGDSVGQGTPWSDSVLTYESTLRVDVVGQFFADEFTEELIRLSDVTFHPYTDIEPPYGEGDGKGEWQSTSYIE